MFLYIGLSVTGETLAKEDCVNSFETTRGLLVLSDIFIEILLFFLAQHQPKY